MPCMKVALEIGEVLDVALLEGERVIGTLSLELKGLAGASRVGRPASATREAKAVAGTEGTGRRRKRKPMSAESRARMAEAQKRRWEKNRSNEGSGSNE